jgi:hypothetical protein
MMSWSAAARPPDVYDPDPPSASGSASAVEDLAAGVAEAIKAATDTEAVTALS